MVHAELVARGALSAHHAIYKERLLVTAMIVQGRAGSCKLRENKDREQGPGTRIGSRPKRTTRLSYVSRAFCLSPFLRENRSFHSYLDA
jgi:hypothetical protein